MNIQNLVTIQYKTQFSGTEFRSRTKPHIYAALVDNQPLKQQKVDTLEPIS